jgi:hypothetical protein
MFIYYCSFTSRLESRDPLVKTVTAVQMKDFEQQLKERSIEKLLLSVDYLQNLFA